METEKTKFRQNKAKKGSNKPKKKAEAGEKQRV
jgi:hypothetical protein